LQAWQFRGVGQPLELVDLPEPSAGPGELVLDVKACGLCHSDVSFIDGTITSLLGHVPIVLGHEIAGVVRSAGEGVDSFRVGDRVGIPATVESPGTARNGGFASQVAVLAEQCIAIPDNVPFEQAAPAMDAARTAYRGVVTGGQVEAGTRLGIIGYGGLGSLAVQIATALQAEVYVAEINEARWNDARAKGAAGVGTDIRQFADRELDVIIDFAGYGTTTAAAIEAVRPRGRVVQIGLAREMATISAQLVTMKELTYLGLANGEKHEAEAVLQLMAEGRISSDITLIGFADIPASLDKLESDGVCGRFVVHY
jgi:propanol-preferring alcohol dehydrogenase